MRRSLYLLCTALAMTPSPDTTASLPAEVSELVLDERVLGLRPVTRTLAVDLLALPGGYPHDKPEGLASAGPGLLAVCNDDDFGITDEEGALVAKRLPGAGGARDRHRVRLLPLPPR